MNCHICNNETDFRCEECDEPVCYDCCVKMTIHNQIDYPLCQVCNEAHECAKADHYQRLEKEKEALEAEKERKAKLRRVNYYKPENIEKRRLARKERKRLEEERRISALTEAFKIVNDMFS